MLAPERYLTILNLLKENHSVNTKDLSQLMGISMETVRRDLDYLESQGRLKKVHGGAVLDILDQSHPAFLDRKNTNSLQKQQIADFALRQIQENMTVAMDASTTNLAIASAMKTHFNRLTVLTNSIAIVNELIEVPNFNIIIPGGSIHVEEMALNGEMCLANIRQLNVELYLLSCNGVSLTAGITDFGEGEVSVKHAMMDIAAKTILVCTHDRFDVISLMKVCNLSSVSSIITDSNLNPVIANRYRENDITIINE